MTQVRSGCVPCATRVRAPSGSGDAAGEQLGGDGAGGVPLAAPRRAVQEVRVRGRPGGGRPEHGGGVRVGLERGEGHGAQGNVPGAWNVGA